MLLTAGLFAPMFFACEQSISEVPTHQEVQGQEHKQEITQEQEKNKSETNTAVAQTPEKKSSVPSQRHDGTVPY